MSFALYGGIDIFGIAVKCQHVPTPSAQQVNSYFGVTGTQLIFGGGRGRTFMITGLLVGSDLSDLAGAEAMLLSFDDGTARTLTDTWGRQWPYVVMMGDYHPDPMGPRPFAAGWALPYRCSLRGLL